MLTLQARRFGRRVETRYGDKFWGPLFSESSSDCEETECKFLIYRANRFRTVLLVWATGEGGFCWVRGLKSLYSKA
jgi:hypothetical protein